MTADLASFPGELGRVERVAERATELTPAASTSAVLWLDYDAPDFVDEAASPHRAEAGAPTLRRFQDGLRATHDGPPARQTRGRAQLRLAGGRRGGHDPRPRGRRASSSSARPASASTRSPAWPSRPTGCGRPPRAATSSSTRQSPRAAPGPRSGAGRPAARRSAARERPVVRPQPERPGVRRPRLRQRARRRATSATGTAAARRWTPWRPSRPARSIPRPGRAGSTPMAGAARPGRITRR